MSTKYKHGEKVPVEVIAARLEELSDACVECMKGNRKPFEREFTFRIPAELDRDADLVLSDAATKLTKQSAIINDLRKALDALYNELVIEQGNTGKLFDNAFDAMQGVKQ